jgi:hypothetical protein
MSFAFKFLPLLLSFLTLILSSVPCRSAHAVQEPAKERGAQAAHTPQVCHGTQRQLHPTGGVQPLPRQYKPGNSTSWIF